MPPKRKRLTLDDLNPVMRQQVLRQDARDKAARSLADMESASGHEPVGTKLIGKDGSLCRIYVTNLRHRMADSDGISGKAMLDGIVEAGLLRDDSPEEVEWVRQTQEKIPKAEKETTLIRIDVYE